jgi:hypothetical protein
MSNVVATPGDLDLWLAVAAGPAVWVDDDEEPGGLELLGGLLIAVVVGIAVLPLVVRDPNIDERSAVVAAGIGVALATVLLCVVPFSLAMGHHAPGLLMHRPYVAALLRGAAAVGFIICWLALMPTAALPLLAFLGVAVGGEGAVTARSLGLPVGVRLWIRSSTRRLAATAGWSPTSTGRPACWPPWPRWAGTTCTTATISRRRVRSAISVPDSCAMNCCWTTWVSAASIAPGPRT